ncbi:sugar kinase [Fulvimarina sp. 2208YS6-2-32]|uniref:Sugar kinase n=1 Tax=Fulvimarina uroteuthidis TaxID=3098149 RepID=A0ABU5I6D7_9HYPH|nr:sugar kinase [Fulvimarina sp. 2208YS6-2-32]MDY8110318.1 sugar kinase [Fulvimarina sp. 2208YS6-2-32]
MAEPHQFLSIGECMIELSGGGAPDAWRMGFAGDTLNTLWYAKAGLDPKQGPVAYLTALGTDDFSDRILAFLRDNAISVDLIRRVPDRRPGLYMIEQKHGDRHFTYWRERSAARRLADDPVHLDTAIGSAKLVYFSGISLAILSPRKRTDLIERLAAARANGQIVAYDPNIRPVLWESGEAMRETIMRGAGAASIVLPSFDDEAGAFGDATPADTVERYRAIGADIVAVKNAGAPVLLDDRTSRSEIQTRSDVQVLDATGAGDSFNGAFLAAYIRTASASEAARAGCDMAARVIAVRGALMMDL